MGEAKRRSAEIAELKANGPKAAKSGRAEIGKQLIKQHWYAFKQAVANMRRKV